MTLPANKMTVAKSAGFDPPWRQRSSPVVRYGLAVVSVVVIGLITGWLRVYFQGTPNAFFFAR